ncbi:hypothetical protein T36_1296 [Helicobacter cinaedi]|uniref:thermonuclease family protein n=1 Tax=Helicobacter cinaedi TaxID=213 RepID=UPI001F363674|nr:thermonuclease family protein [Helicobacter cinaedi]BDB64839.1 hypothetical protein T36_1296 [Helicobacter cinaedi]
MANATTTIGKYLNKETQMKQRNRKLPLRKTQSILIIVALSILALVAHINGYNFAYLNGKEITGKIVKVADGDTLTLLHNGENLKIRFYGIDAPKSQQSFGKESKNNLLKLCPLNSTAKIKIKDKDKYQRIVGIVFCNNVDVNAKQVEDGYAWAYREYSLAYLHLEIQARAKSKGLWSEENPIKPSNFRKL